MALRTNCSASAALTSGRMSMNVGRVPSLRVKSLMNVSSGCLSTPRFIVASIIQVESAAVSSMATCIRLSPVLSDVAALMASDIEPLSRL